MTSGWRFTPVLSESKKALAFYGEGLNGYKYFTIHQVAYTNKTNNILEVIVTLDNTLTLVYTYKRIFHSVINLLKFFKYIAFTISITNFKI